MKKYVIGLIAVLVIGAGAWMFKPSLVPTASASPKAMVVYKSPTCGCCGGWITHADNAGYQVTAHDVEDMDKYKTAAKVPGQLESCHTTLIGGYVIEGHVPMREIERLLKEKPAGALGLAVPGMVSGSPGMENGRFDPYDVIIFFKDGKTEIYASYLGK
ncbi:MAG: DUF411 domain-containing protein [Robiginitomaculum sp.]|nr:DUF411 domain-containing protein [Robiginitomaculum sp.]